MQRTRLHIPHRFVALAIVFVAMLVSVPSALAVESSGSDSVGFGVSPMRFDLKTSPGSSSTHKVTITNTDTSATRFTFTKEDFSGDQKDPGATPVMLGGKFESPISGYDWIAAPEPISIPPGESRTIDVKVNVPSGATGGHYAALMVTGEARGAGALVATSRFGVLFMMNAGGVPPPEIVITEIQEVGPTREVVQFINNGTQSTTGTTGTITRNPVGPGPTTTIEGECTQEVLPGAAGECTFETGEGEGSGSSSNSSEAGQFGPVEQYVDIVGDPGEEGTSARGELPTEWAGAWTSLLLPLVGIALFVLYFLFLRRRRKNEEEGDGGGDGLAWSGPGAT